MEMVSCNPDDSGGGDGFLLSFDDPDDVLDDVGGAHDDVALVMVEPLGPVDTHVDDCLIMGLEP